MDIEEGWQYAHSFEDPEDQWSGEPPPQLERLLSGSGTMTVGLSGSTGRQGSSSNMSGAQKWVRRRRWVRVMRRRLDIPPLPFMEPDGGMYMLTADGTLIPFVEECVEGGSQDGDGRELGTMPASFLSVSQDYVARARYLAGTHHGSETPGYGDEASAADVRRAIAKLERAVMELRTGMLGEILFNLHFIAFLSHFPSRG